MIACLINVETEPGRNMAGNKFLDMLYKAYITTLKHDAFRVMMMSNANKLTFFSFVMIRDAKAGLITTILTVPSILN